MELIYKILKSELDKRKNIQSKKSVQKENLPFPEVYDPFKDVFEYMCLNFGNNHPFFIINSEKKTSVLCAINEKIKFKCDERDIFDKKIGFAMALSHSFKNSKKHKAMREFFRNKKRILDYKKYYKWVLLDYCNYDYKRLNELSIKLDNLKDNEKLYI